MAIPSFFHPTLTDADETIRLSQTESGHALKSRRLRVGDAVRVMNGAGLVASGLLRVEGRQASVELTEFKHIKRRSPALTIASAIPKGDRHKTMLDMLTQLGAAAIVPLVCERSVTSYNQNMHDKWQRIAIEACKQSHNAWLPVIGEQTSLSDFLEQCPGTILYADAGGASMSAISKPSGAVACLIGPEGGFSDSELGLLSRLEVTPVRLAEYTLRTETAAIAACSQWVQLN